MGRIWEINGQSLELDLDNADNMERYENAFEIMSEEEKNLSEEGRQSERIRAYCRLFENLYDRIFGEGTSEKIFEGIPASIGRYDEIYESFLNFVKNQALEIAKASAERRMKYLPKKRK
ncbi:MAG: hypothetical protein MJZ03_05615 [archaeon]|nr:hypothetical protein [archaeon]